MASLQQGRLLAVVPEEWPAEHCAFLCVFCLPYWEAWFGWQTADVMAFCQIKHCLKIEVLERQRQTQGFPDRASFTGNQLTSGPAEAKFSEAEHFSDFTLWVSFYCVVHIGLIPEFRLTFFYQSVNNWMCYNVISSMFDLWFLPCCPGGMQDYSYLYGNCLEITMELSCCKYPSASELHKEWDLNRESLLAYMEKVELLTYNAVMMHQRLL